MSTAAPPPPPPGTEVRRPVPCQAAPAHVLAQATWLGAARAGMGSVPRAHMRGRLRLTYPLPCLLPPAAACPSACPSGCPSPCPCLPAPACPRLPAPPQRAYQGNENTVSSDEVLTSLALSLLGAAAVLVGWAVMRSTPLRHHLVKRTVSVRGPRSPSFAARFELLQGPAWPGLFILLGRARGRPKRCRPPHVPPGAAGSASIRPCPRPRPAAAARPAGAAAAAGPGLLPGLLLRLPGPRAHAARRRVCADRRPGCAGERERARRGVPARAAGGLEGVRRRGACWQCARPPGSGQPPARPPACRRLAGRALRPSPPAGPLPLPGAGPAHLHAGGRALLRRL